MLIKKAVTIEPLDQQNAVCAIFCREWGIGLFFSLVSFFVASIMMTGWPSGLFLNMSYPYVYSGDGLAFLAYIQRLREGSWIFFNDRLGFPFGCNVLDYPLPDVGCFFVFKMLGRACGAPQAAMNLFFLIGFSLSFIFSYVFFRIVRISRLLSISGGLLFAFLPFHFQRIAHLSLTWYFVVPVFFYFGMRLFFLRPARLEKSGLFPQHAMAAMVLFVLTSLSCYYASFGCLVLVASAVAGTLRNRSYRSLVTGILAVAIVIAAVFVNVTPHFHHRAVVGENVEAANRSSSESELHGLKIIQMLLPHLKHRVKYFNGVAESYKSSFPLVGENQTSSLGFIGAVGFLILLCVAFVLMCGFVVDPRLAFFSFTSISLFFVATIGGFSSLFALAITPLLRGWNRASVFIGFAAITSVLLVLQIGLKRFFSKSLTKKLLPFLAIVLCIFGLWEQTSPVPVSENDAIRAAFESDKSFVAGIEKIVPAKSAIYQLPYMPYPETPQLFELDSYGLLIGFLHSQTLRWSYGGMRGREGDLFFRALAQQPLQKQVEVMRRLGFAGIYIDRRGFKDHGREVEGQLQLILGEGPELHSADGNLVFFKMLHPVATLNEGLSPQAIMAKGGFWVTPWGARYQATLSEGIDFRREGWPAFVEEIKGVSCGEPWGRWSDANLNKSVEIKFVNPLPASFTLILRAIPFGGNSGAPVRVQVGDYSEAVVFLGGLEEKRIRVVTRTPASAIKIFPPFPESPASLGLSSDPRKLGLGFERLSIDTN